MKKFPAWATPGEKRKLFGRAKGYGADELILSDFDATSGFLEGKSGDAVAAFVPPPGNVGNAGAWTDANFDQAVSSSLILSIKAGRKTYTASGVAVSKKRALTALHGVVSLNTPVTITTRNGTKLSGRVEFQSFEEDAVDVAVIKLNSSAVFQCFMPYSEQPVRLAQSIAVVGLKFARTSDSVGLYARVTTVEAIREEGALFHAQYYSFDGCSGTGVVTAAVGNVLRVVGVHVASHDDTTLGGSKGRKKRTYSDLEASVPSAIHGHTAYSLVCDIARVPDLLKLLRGP